MIVIAVVALIVFGPRRLPEIARKASELLAKTREATKSVTNALDTEYDGITAPLKDLKTDYDSTVKGFKDVASSATDFSVDLTSTSSGTDKGEEDDSSPQHDGDISSGEAGEALPDAADGVDEPEDDSQADT